MGELSLDGGLLPIKAVLPIAIQARKEGFKGFILPKHNAREAAIVDDLDVYGVDNISEVFNFFNGTGKLEKTVVDIEARSTTARQKQNLISAMLKDKRISKERWK